jgi:hypothetical protein
MYSNNRKEKKEMKKTVWLVLGVMAAACMLSCNNGMSSVNDGRGDKQATRDRSQRTVIDDAEYIDFTIPKHNARTVRKEDVLYTLNNTSFKNGNSLIRIKAQDGVVEISSDSGRYNGKDNCQVYGVLALEIKAASDDCLYIRRDPRKEGFVLIDGVMFRNAAIPDLAVCLPLYGYSRNRIEVSSIMDGYIVMPSGTYWKQ